MKTLFRILIIITACVVFYLITSNSNTTKEPLTGPNSSSKVIPMTENVEEGFEDALPRPEKGLSTLIGKSSKKLLEEYGQPNRKDKTLYGYEWWVYNNKQEEIVMFGVEENGMISQVYTNSNSYDVSPYKIGDTLDDVYRKTIVNNEITAKIEDNIYTFILTEDDMKTRILTKFDQIFAQLYMNSEDEKLSGIRFMNSETLIKHRPYEMTFVGKLVTVPEIDSFLINETNIASSKQLVDLTNSFRLQNNVESLTMLDDLNEIASGHSENMYINEQTKDSVDEEPLKARLDGKNIEYDEHVEILATSYLDSIEAIHGFLNSNKHRKILLDDDYTHIGTGVFLNYYTQVFINQP